MTAQPIYRKTAKGVEAIAARMHGLVGRWRSLLILVDGKRSGGELLALASGFGDAAQMLRDLESDGFIEPLPGSIATSKPAAAAVTTIAAAVANVAASATVPATAAADTPTLTFGGAKKFASRQLLALLGPSSEPLCVKIEAAHNMADFIAAVKLGYARVREFRGAAEADRFGAAVEATLPPS